MKKGLETYGKASFPHASKPLFQFAKANPRSCTPRTAALVSCAKGNAVFAAAKTSGRIRRCGGAIVRPARFAAAKRRSPEDAITQYRGRPGRLRRPGRAKRAEKESGDHRGELARIRGIRSLFRIACRNKPTQDWFSRELGERNPPLPFGR